MPHNKNEALHKLQEAFQEAQEIYDASEIVNQHAKKKSALMTVTEDEQTSKNPKSDKEKIASKQKQASWIKWVKGQHDELAKKAESRIGKTLTNDRYFCESVGVYIYSLAAIAAAVSCVLLVNKIKILSLAARGHWARELYDETEKNSMQYQKNNSSFARNMGVYTYSFGKAIFSKGSEMVSEVKKAGTWFYSEVSKNADARLNQLSVNESDLPQNKSSTPPGDPELTSAEKNITKAKTNNISFGKKLGVYLLSFSEMAVTSAAMVITKKFI